MKSIREWMSDKGIMGEDFDKSAMAKYFGSTSVEVDQTLRGELKHKIIRIVDLKKDMPRNEVLDRIKAAISKLVAGASGNRLNSRSLADKLSDDENRVNKNRFANMMGSDSVEIDAQIRRELEPKIEYIKSMEDPKTNQKYGDMPKSELESRLIAVATQVVAEMPGGTMSIGSVSRKMDSFEEDPIAKESASLPSFLTWIEENEEGTAVSEPQHEEGEDNMDLKAVVEKRLMQMAMDMEEKGKGSRKEVLAAMKAVVDSASSESDKGEQQDGQDQQPPADQMAGTPVDPQMQPQA